VIQPVGHLAWQDLQEVLTQTHNSFAGQSGDCPSSIYSLVVTYF
jgi:hypothetical protein